MNSKTDMKEKYFTWQLSPNLYSNQPMHSERANVGTIFRRHLSRLNMNSPQLLQMDCLSAAGPTAAKDSLRTACCWLITVTLLGITYLPRFRYPL